MTDCWNDGDLRAYADRELAPAEMEKLAAHLAECAGCEVRYREVAERAERVGAWMAELRAPVPAGAGPAAGTVRRVRTWPRWAAALTMAAGLALILMQPAAKPVAPQGTARLSTQFVALDDDPIDTGVVVRVAVGPNQVQADVIVGPDGRARAFRLVGSPSSN
jgi:predicted anti-sigma-YlaC factor YlaD